MAGMEKLVMAKAQAQARMKKAGSDRDRAMQAAKAASTRSPTGALTPREALQKMTKDRPMSAPRPKPPSVAFDPVTGIPPKGKQPDMKKTGSVVSAIPTTTVKSGGTGIPNKAMYSKGGKIDGRAIRGKTKGKMC